MCVIRSCCRNGAETGKSGKGVFHSYGAPAFKEKTPEGVTGVSERAISMGDSNRPGRCMQHREQRQP
jgi:hypothetical protein